jgi:hypothetical protein
MNKPITDAELEIMRLLWREKRAMTAADICAALEPVKDWNKSTIRTLVLRLREKGAVNTWTNGVGFTSHDEMMNGMRRTLPFLLAVCLFIALTACNAGELTETSSPPPSVTAGSLIFVPDGTPDPPSPSAPEGAERLGYRGGNVNGVYYWSVDEDVYNRLTPDGKDETALIVNGDRFNYCDGSVYYMKLGYNNYNFYRYDVATGSEEPITAFTGEIFDGKGTIIEGVDIYHREDLPSDPEGDESFFDDNATCAFILQSKPYLRGSLRACLLLTGGARVDCLFASDAVGNTIVWD